MKFKFDFVTNSSSTCYVVFVPNSFSVTDEMIQIGINDEAYWWEYEDDEIAPTVETTRKEIHECIELLKEGENLYSSNSGDGVDYKIYAVIQNIINQADLNINSLELSSSGENTILGISEKSVANIFINNIKLTNFIKVKSNDEENKK